MATYKGKPVVINHSASEVYDRVSNLGAFQERLESLPEQARAQLGDVKFTDSSIVITAPAVGEMVFNVTERIPGKLMKLSAANSPVPFQISIDLDELAPDSTQVATSLNVEIPAMLKPMIGGKMQEAADKFSEMFSTLFTA